MENFYGLKLRIARNFQGLSLEEVGLLVAASRQYIQQLEKEAKRPNEEMVFALADALKVEREFFFMPETNPLVEDQCHFRSRQSATVSTKAQAMAYGSLFDDLSIILEQTLDMPPVNFPEEEMPKTAADIERIAEKSRQHWSLGLTGPINNMIRVAENAGALVTDFVGVSEKVDAFSIHRKRPLIIRNLAKESPCRRRYDIAHECAHLIMHSGINTGDKQTEEQANRFASAFLLPRIAFLKEFPKTKDKLPWNMIYKMKVRWGVSAAAIVRRAYDLNLLDAAQYRRANVYLRKSGQTKYEKHDEKVPQEEPELIRNSFELMENNAKQELILLLKRMAIKQTLLETLTGYKFKEEITSELNNIINFTPKTPK